MQLKHLDFHYLVIHLANLTAMFSVAIGVVAVVVAWGIKYDDRAHASAPPVTFIDQSGGNYGYQPPAAVNNIEPAFLPFQISVRTQPVERLDIVSSASLNRITGSTSLHVIRPADGIIYVTYSIDSQLLGQTATTPFELNWNSTKVLNGYHWIRAQATDHFGHVTERSLLVQVSN